MIEEIHKSLIARGHEAEERGERPLMFEERHRG